jgi:hypothetical protein
MPLTDVEIEARIQAYAEIEARIQAGIRAGVHSYEQGKRLDEIFGALRALGEDDRRDAVRRIAKAFASDLAQPLSKELLP